MNISLTKMVKIQNSSDSDSGRRPMLKSDEFSFFSILVIEIWMLRFDTFSKNAILFGSATHVLAFTVAFLLLQHGVQKALYHS